MGTHRQNAVIILWSGITAAFVFIAIYASIYWFEPFSSPWNDLLTNLLGILAVGLSAVASTAIFWKYRSSLKHHSVWLCFSLGLWAWFIADSVWGIYNMTVVEVPGVSFADLFYILGYCFIYTALHRQFWVMFRPSLHRDILITGGLMAAVLLVTLLFTLGIAGFQLRDVKLSSMLNLFYPIGDMAVAIVALVFVVNFGRGAFARPWLGLAVFCVTDSLYAWLYESGNYAFTLSNSNMISLIADTLYTAAYLILALLLLNHFLLLEYGPAIPVDR
jgi:hypothetical protein